MFLIGIDTRRATGDRLIAADQAELSVARTINLTSRECLARRCLLLTASGHRRYADPGVPVGFGAWAPLRRFFVCSNMRPLSRMAAFVSTLIWVVGGVPVHGLSSTRSAYRLSIELIHRVAYPSATAGRPTRLVASADRRCLSTITNPVIAFALLLTSIDSIWLAVARPDYFYRNCGAYLMTARRCGVRCDGERLKTNVSAVRGGTG